MSWLTLNLTARVQEQKSPPPTEAGKTATLRKIRSSMLAALDDRGNSGDRQHRLQLRIHLAPDAQSLWALRGELMTVLAGDRGEACAVAQLLQLTRLFRDVLPPGLASSLDQHSQGDCHAGKDRTHGFRQG